MMKKTKYMEENKDPLPYYYSIDDLPTPILHDILAKLPYKSLQRSKCVSKSWCSHISSHAFAILHRRHSHELSFPDQHSPYRLLIFTNHNDIAGGLYTDSNMPIDSIYYTDLDNLIECENSQLPKKILLPPRLENQRYKYMAGSCNSLLLCECRGDRDDRVDDELMKVCLALVNPLTGAYREIPRLRVMTYELVFRNRYYTVPVVSVCGLVYDCLKDDYKVITLGYLNPFFGWDVWVYSLRVGSWRIVSCDHQQKHVPFFGMNALIYRENNNVVLIDNHLLHWLFVSRSNEKPIGIACFDGCNEEWSEVPLPDSNCSVYRYNAFVSQLGVLDGCLCFLADLKSPDTEVNRRTYVVMIMKEYGVKESWIKLFNIFDDYITLSLNVCPIVYSLNKSEILLMNSWPGVFLYNLRDKTIKVAIKPQATQKMTMSTFTCIQSLVPFPGCSNLIMAKQGKGE